MTPTHMNRASADALPPNSRLEEYHIEKVIARGGFGIVYAATDQLRAREVAIKEYFPSDYALRGENMEVYPYAANDDFATTFRWGLDSFAEEARLMETVSAHPSFARMYRHFRANGTAYIVMERVHGTTLRRRLAQPPRLSDKEVRTIFLDLLAGVSHLHEQNVWHRDIKPANIMLHPDGRPVLLDFGSARQARGRQSEALTALMSGPYTPIEQIEPSVGDQGPWTDIYSLGAVLYESISGIKPPTATARHCGVPLVPLTLDECGPGLWAAIEWALLMAPHERPRDVAAWCEMLWPVLGLTDDTDERTRLRPSYLCTVATTYPASEGVPVPCQPPRNTSESESHFRVAKCGEPESDSWHGPLADELIGETAGLHSTPSDTSSPTEWPAVGRSRRSSAYRHDALRSLCNGWRRRFVEFGPRGTFLVAPAIAFLLTWIVAIGVHAALRMGERGDAKPDTPVSVSVTPRGDTEAAPSSVPSPSSAGTERRHEAGNPRSKSTSAAKPQRVTRMSEQPCASIGNGAYLRNGECVRDEDGDSVEDEADRCPGTPLMTAVDEWGCPIEPDRDRDGVPDSLDACPSSNDGASVAQDGCEFDQDHDGVPDAVDRCPVTVPPEAVDSNGCHLDSDGDGVPDFRDKCRDTPQQKKVDAMGCEAFVPGTIFKSNRSLGGNTG